MTHLIKCADRRNEDDGIGIIKIWNPSMALSTSTTDVEQVPSYCFAVDIHVKYVFSYAHSLDTSMQNVVCREKCEYMRKGG